MEQIPEKKIHRTLIILLLTNAIIGLGDLGGALLLIFREESTDILAWISTIIHPAQAYLTRLASAFIAMGDHVYALAIFYFVSHGVIKLFLVWALLRGKLWAYPLAIFFFGLFSLYQLIVLIRHPSMFDLVILALNVFVLILVSKEYRTVRSRYAESVN